MTAQTELIEVLELFCREWALRHEDVRDGFGICTIDPEVRPADPIYGDQTGFSPGLRRALGILDELKAGTMVCRREGV